MRFIKTEKIKMKYFGSCLIGFLLLVLKVWLFIIIIIIFHGGRQNLTVRNIEKKAKVKSFVDLWAGTTQCYCESGTALIAQLNAKVKEKL